MSFQGRSPDDLPLAAYSTGVAADDEDEESIAEPPHLSQQEALALAMGIAPAAPAEPAEPVGPAEPAPDSGSDGSARPRPSLPRLSLPQFSLPRFSLPRFALPRLGSRSQAVATAESPFQVTAQPLTMSVAHAPATSARHVPRRTSGVALGDIAATLRNPRTAVRDPRILVGGVIAIGVVLLGMNLLGGLNLGALGPGASPTPPAGPPASAPPGVATIQVAGKVETTFSLNGNTGFGRPADGHLASTWGDGAGATLSINGRVGSGTRTTTTDLVVGVTVVLNGAPVTFTSQAGECTVGMAEKLFNVIGSFVCPKITSADGKVTVKLTGSYQT